jgi:hypothetical protein
MRGLGFKISLKKISSDLHSSDLICSQILRGSDPDPVKNPLDFHELSNGKSTSEPLNLPLENLEIVCIPPDRKIIKLLIAFPRPVLVRNDALAAQFFRL